MQALPSRISVSPAALVLAIFAVLYTLAYLSAPNLPGQIGHPEGWWGWADQSMYLKAARAFAVLNLNGDQHWYPFLYGLTGAPFARLMPLHPFFVVDIVCFLIVAGGFLRIATPLIGLPAAAILFIAVISFPWIIAPQWIIPWNSTLSAAITTLLLLACTNEQFAEARMPVRYYFLFALFASLLCALRPLEIVTALVMYGYIAIGWIIGARKRAEPILAWNPVRVAAALAVGTTVGPMLLWAFHMKVYGQFMSPYMGVSAQAGLNLASIPEKFVSMFVDSDALYLINKQTFLAGFPWLLATFAVLPAVLLFGPRIMRLIIVLASVHVALYLAYGDLLPDNLYQYYTIHYFKLWFPYFALIAVFGLILWVKAPVSLRVRALVIGAGILLAFAVTCLGFRFRPEPIRTARAGAQTVVVEPADSATATLNFLDFYDFGSDDVAKYVVGENTLEADGKPLRRLGDFHMYKAPWGSRVSFTRPVTFKRLSIKFDNSFKFPAGTMSPAGFQYVIRLRRPYWFRP